MELIRKNYANTTTQFVVNDNTASVANVLGTNLRFQYSSANFANDATTVTMRINFDATTAVDRIAIVGHNLKSFTLFYNGATANVFSLSTTANTSTTNYSSNSDTSHYFTVTPVNCTSVSIDMKSTIQANQNKAIGYLVISEDLTDFGERVPSADNYRPVHNSTSVEHRLSDGGTRIQTVEDKWSASIAFDYLSASTRNSLKTIFDDHDEMVFVPFGTTTGWDGVIFPCVWQGGFEFYKHSDNAVDTGFSGSITLLETPE